MSAAPCPNCGHEIPDPAFRRPFTVDDIRLADLEAAVDRGALEALRRAKGDES